MTDEERKSWEYEYWKAVDRDIEREMNKECDKQNMFDINNITEQDLRHDLKFLFNSIGKLKTDVVREHLNTIISSIEKEFYL